MASPIRSSLRHQLRAQGLEWKPHTKYKSFRGRFAKVDVPKFSAKEIAIGAKSFLFRILKGAA